MRRIVVDIAEGLTAERAAAALDGLDLHGLDLRGRADALAALLAGLYDSYRALDAELLEINPLALTEDGRLLCLDCKYTLDDASLGRQAAVAEPARRSA